MIGIYKWVTNDIDELRIPEDKVDYYISVLGYRRGRKKFSDTHITNLSISHKQ